MRVVPAAHCHGQGKGWVFLSPVYPGRPINATSLLKALQRMWHEHEITAHGFRATYRTIALWLNSLR